MKRPRLWISAFLISVCGAPAAFAETITTYDITFSGTGLNPTAGSFTYDSTNPSFSDFTVTWDGILFNLTAAANAPSITAPEPACLGGATGAAATFDLLSGDCDSPPADNDTLWSANQNEYGAYEGFGFASYNYDTGSGFFVDTSISDSPAYPQDLVEGHGQYRR